MLLTSEFVTARYDALRRRAPHIDVVTELQPGANPDIDALFAFKLPEGIASRLPNLRLAASVGAGADGILAAPDLPAHVRVTRAEEPGLGLGMAQFVVMQILRQFRSQPQLSAQNAAGEWKRVTVPDARQTTVGIMGLGAIGGVVAEAVAQLGFKVVGWTRSASRETKIPTHVGAGGLNAFLAASNFLVCLLPLTELTRDLLDRRTLSLLPPGAFVVNVARGGILVEDDLLTLVDSGHLSGAALDVFAVEPLPRTSSLWDRPNIWITPHVAAQASVEPAVEQFIDNLRRLRAGEPLRNEVDRQQGY